MLKTGLSVAHFHRYVPLIEKETWDYFERWEDSGEKSRGLFVLARLCRALGQGVIDNQEQMLLPYNAPTTKQTLIESVSLLNFVCAAQTCNFIW